MKTEVSARATTGKELEVPPSTPGDMRVPMKRVPQPTHYT